MQLHTLAGDQVDRAADSEDPPAWYSANLELVDALQSADLLLASAKHILEDEGGEESWAARDGEKAAQSVRRRRRAQALAILRAAEAPLARARSIAEAMPD